jgi:hypothetical protein
MAEDGRVDPERVLDEFEERLQHSAFGEATRASYRLESALEDAQITAARNLLEKAARELEAGDRDGAARFAGRALAIRAEVEGAVPPGPEAVSILLFTEMAERCDAGHRSADAGWLDPLLDAHRAASGQLAVEIERCLDSLAEYGVTPAEEQRIDAVTRRGSRLEEPLGEVDDEPTRVETVLGMLRVLLELRAP